MLYNNRYINIKQEFNMPLDTKAKILIVDDMGTMRKIIKNMLSKMGCKDLSEADDGLPAWDMLVEAKSAGRPFQFIVSDWNMPGLTGLDLLKKIRARIFGDHTYRDGSTRKHI